jgi:hypothetical protein
MTLKNLVLVNSINIPIYIFMGVELFAFFFLVYGLLTIHESTYKRLLSAEKQKE